MPRSRDLDWDGLLNARDLGGHPTEDGAETRWGSVVRADSVRQLTDAGWQAVVDYGVRTIVDLRSDEELAEDPPAEKPVEAVHVSFFDSRPEVFEEVEQASAAAADHAAATREVYLIFLEHFRPNVAAAIRAVANAPEGGVVVHCHGGKDRTGLVSAFLLRLAGVPIEEIATDYSLSEERRHPARGMVRAGRRRGRARAPPPDLEDARFLHGAGARGARAAIRQHRRLPEGRRSDRRGARAGPVPPP